MRKILSFTDYYWPGYKAGGTVRAFMNQIDYLKEEYEFSIVTRNTDYTENIPYKNVRAAEWNELMPNVRVFYIPAESQKPGTFWRLMKNGGYDTVYIHLLFGFWYSILPLIFAKLLGYKHIIVSPHGALGRGALNVKPTRKKVFFFAVRILGLYRGVVFHSASEHETEDIRANIGKRAKIAFAREFPRKVMKVPVRDTKIKGKLRMVTIARVSPEKNQLFALEFLAKCSVGEINYDLIGPVHDEGYWQKCLEQIKLLPENVKVTVRGSISSEKIPEELQHYDVMLLPTTGENFGHTVLESFMSGCPVIISDQTPWKGLEVRETGFDIPLANPEAFVKAVNFFVQTDDSEFRKYSDKAYKFAQTYCSSPEMYPENIQLFRGRC